MAPEPGEIRSEHAQRAHVSLMGPRPPPRSAAPSASPARGSARALWIVAICCLAATLRLASEALIPLGLALLIACVLSGTVEALHRHRVPRAASAVVLLALLSAAIAGTLDLVATPAQQWLQSAPQVLHTIERKVRPAQSLVRRLDYITRSAAALASPGSDAAAAPASRGASLSALDIFAATGTAAVGAVTVLAFALLLLAAGPATLARLACACGARLPAARALELSDAVRREVGRYYGTLLLINLCFAALTAGLMWLLGMPSALLWGVLAALLNLIPYLGPALCVTILSVVGLVTFASSAHVLLVAAAYLLLATVEGHVIEPIFLGRRLDLHPLVVLLALWIGGWLWGVAGLVLALPTLVALKVARHTSGRNAGEA